MFPLMAWHESFDLSNDEAEAFQHSDHGDDDELQGQKIKVAIFFR